MSCCNLLTYTKFREVSKDLLLDIENTASRYDIAITKRLSPNSEQNISQIRENHLANFLRIISVYKTQTELFLSQNGNKLL